MKNLLIILITMLMNTCFSQVKEYPRFEVDSLGQKVVVMTIPQAMKLNNNSNLLANYEKLSIEMQNYENACIKVVNDKDIVIAKLDGVISKLDEQIVIKDDKIKTLQNEILDWMQKNKVLELQVINRQDLINEKDKQIGRLKTKMVIGGSIGGLAVVVLILKIVGIF